MVALATYEEAVDHLRLDGDADQSDVELKIEAASEVVLNYLGNPDEYFDTAGEINADSIPAVVKKAVLYLTGVLYSDRDGVGDAWKDGKLPPAVVGLLSSIRTPTLA
jgi:hypothetical protein